MLKDICKFPEFLAYTFWKKLVFEMSFQLWLCIFFLQTISNHLKSNQKKLNAIFHATSKL